MNLESFKIMKHKRNVEKHIKEVGKDKFKEQALISLIDQFMITKSCRKCRSIWNKHKTNAEEDINKILNKKQYCIYCNIHIEKITKIIPNQ